MDVTVALLVLRKPHLCPPVGVDAFDILLAARPQQSSAPAPAARSLPRVPIDCSATTCDLAGEVIAAARGLFSRKALCRRALPIPIHTDENEPSTSQAFSSRFFVLPIPGETLSDMGGPSEGLKLVPFADVLHEATIGAPTLDVETRHFLIRLDTWLAAGQMDAADFLARLFSLRPAGYRFRQCAHNPANDPKAQPPCLAVSHPDASPDGHKIASDLTDSVKRSNRIRVKMITLDKVDKFHINPGFNPNRRAPGLVYFAKGRTVLRDVKLDNTLSAADVWKAKYPLHSAAYENDHDLARALLDQGYLADTPDCDSWTPLHYCAFYGHLKAAQVLMNQVTADVNKQNRNGETPLHLASLNGHYNLIELMLSHACLDREIRNNHGRTALEVCESNPKPNWQRATYLLRELHLTKIEVHHGEKGSLHIQCGEMTTADDLQQRVMAELGLDPRCAPLFSIWLVASRLSLQLSPGQVVTKNVRQYEARYGETPTVVLQRKALVTVRQEKELTPFCPIAISLLFDEAVKNYLAGLGPNTDTVFVAAILALLRFGDVPITEDMLPQIFVPHSLPPSSRKARALIAEVEKCARQHCKIRDHVTLQRQLLKNFWELKWYGSTYFQATMHMSRPQFLTVAVHIGINDYGMTVIYDTTRDAMNIFKHATLSYVLDGDSLNFDVARSTYVFSFTTPQAKYIDVLLKKWKQHYESSRRTSAANTPAVSRR